MCDLLQTLFLATSEFMTGMETGWRMEEEQAPSGVSTVGGGIDSGGSSGPATVEPKGRFTCSPDMQKHTESNACSQKNDQGGSPLMTGMSLRVLLDDSVTEEATVVPGMELTSFVVPVADMHVFTNVDCCCGVGTVSPT